MSTATVDDINWRLEDKHGLEAPKVHIVQFRPNIEIEGPVPYAEVQFHLLVKSNSYCIQHLKLPVMDCNHTMITHSQQ